MKTSGGIGYSDIYRRYLYGLQNYFKLFYFHIIWILYWKLFLFKKFYSCEVLNLYYNPFSKGLCICKATNVFNYTF